jgi:hypothetical protein
MTTKTKLSILAALVGATGLSFGGMKATVEVGLYSGGYYSGAQGNVTDARNSADATQYIGCDVTTYPNNGTSYISCSARNAAGQYATCYTSQPSPAMVDLVQSIGPRSTVHFSYSTSSGVCQWIKVSNMSHAGGMQ